MVFELAGFLCGVAGVGSAFLLMYRRDSSRVMRSIYAGAGLRQRG